MARSKKQAQQHTAATAAKSAADGIACAVSSDIDELFFASTEDGPQGNDSGTVEEDTSPAAAVPSDEARGSGGDTAPVPRGFRQPQKRKACAKLMTAKPKQRAKVFTEIARLQAAPGLHLPRSPFVRVVKDVVHDLGKDV